MKLEYHRKISKIFRVYFFKELEFLELKFHSKLEFHKLEFQKSDRTLYISNLLIFLLNSGSGPFSPLNSH